MTDSSDVFVILSPHGQKNRDNLQWYDKALMVPHEPIRNDLIIMKRLVSLTNMPWEQRWKAKWFFRWYKDWFYELVHDHHGAEEKIFFPWLSEKVSLPPKMSDDHRNLMNQLDEIKNLSEKFQDLVALEKYDEWNAAVSDLSRKIIDMETIMLRHLDEEEEVCPPILKEHYTEKQMDVIVNEVLKDAGEGATKTLPWIVERMECWGGPEETAVFMKNLPFPVRVLFRFFWKPSFVKFNRNILKTLEEYSEKEPKYPSTSCFA